MCLFIGFLIFRVNCPPRNCDYTVCTRVYTVAAALPPMMDPLIS